MGNLISNYVNNFNKTKPVKEDKPSARSYFSSTIQSFDQSSDKLIKPLGGKGHLVNDSITHMPKEMARDTVYTTKALADGIRGKANDHQLGKLNDLGLKLSGIAIATYLMTRKATPKQKMMEFVGFGAFLASMALWPKIALEIPARIIHGFNFRKQYVDEQGRKKQVTIDPNYIPFDLYKGDKKSENLDVIADRAGIKRDIPNRHEAVKEHMRKVSVQNNTLWMLTAGLAVPLMTALGCNQAEKFITPRAEKYSNKKANATIDDAYGYLHQTMKPKEMASFEAKLSDTTGEAAKVPEMVKKLKGKAVKVEDIAKLSDTLAAGFDAEMKDAAREDITRLIGGEKYITNATSAEKMAKKMHSIIELKDSALGSKLSPDRLKEAISQGTIRGAVRDMLTTIGVDVIDPTGKFKEVSDNFKCKEVENIDFFQKTEFTAGMSPVERLTHNIKSIVMKVNNSRPEEDFIPKMSALECSDKDLKLRIDAKIEEQARSIAERFYNGDLAVSENRTNYITRAVNKLFKSEVKERGPKSDKLFADLGNVVKGDVASHRGFVIGDKAASAIQAASTEISRYNSLDRLITDSAHFKLEKANETLVANNWSEVSDLLIDKLGITDKELQHASKDQEYSGRLIREKLEGICSNKDKYEGFIKDLAGKMAELDEKMDAPNSDSSGRMMDKLKKSIEKNCEKTGESLGESGFSSMKAKMYGVKDAGLGINIGSIMNSKVERLNSRIDGVHSTYMRLLETAEFFHRSSEYEAAVAKNGGNVSEAIAKEFGMTTNAETNKEIIRRGKEVLLDAHTNKFYTKMGLHNNNEFFQNLMKSLYRPNNADNWTPELNASTERTVKLLDEVKIDGKHPRRVFEGVERRPIGQKLKEHMSHIYNSMGSIIRGTISEDKEVVKTAVKLGESDKRACKRFDLLGKAPSEMFHDTLKQKYNSKKWMKTFAPVLGTLFGATVLAQFFFGKKDPDIKA